MNLIYLGNDEECRMPQGTYTIDRVPPKSTYMDRNRSDTTISETFESPAEEVMEELYVSVEAYFRKKFGFGIVRREDGLWNYVKPDGTFLSTEWFEFAGDFYEGIAEVQRENGEWCYLTTDGTLTEKRK